MRRKRLKLPHMVNIYVRGSRQVYCLSYVLQLEGIKLDCLSECYTYLSFQLLHPYRQLE